MSLLANVCHLIIQCSSSGSHSFEEVEEDLFLDRIVAVGRGSRKLPNPADAKARPGRADRAAPLTNESRRLRATDQSQALKQSARTAPFQGKRLIRQNGVSKQNSKRGFSLDSDEYDVQVMDKEISLKIEKYFFEIIFAGYIQTMTIICSRKINSSSNYKNVVDF